jgi:hypothetical protein
MKAQASFKRLPPPATASTSGRVQRYGLSSAPLAGTDSRGNSQDASEENFARADAAGLRLLAPLAKDPGKDQGRHRGHAGARR